MIFLLRYDRRAGKLISFRAFDDVDRLMAESTRLDLELSGTVSETDEEIVLLEANSEADLRRTHRRYFESAQDLVKSAANEAAASSRMD